MRNIYRTLVVFTLLATLSLADVADAATFLQYQSVYGDPIGKGGEGIIAASGATFRATQQYPYAHAISVTIDEPGNQWWLLFAPIQESSALVPGVYDNASGDLDTIRPWMRIASHSEGCQGFGRFTILEIEVAADNTVTRLAADFEQYCYGGPQGLFGGIRLNSDVAYVAPQLPVLGPTFIELKGPLEDLSIRGQSVRITPADGLFGVLGDPTRGVSAQVWGFPGTTNAPWSLAFAPPVGQVFGPGEYEGVGGWGISYPQATIDISGPSYDCTHYGHSKVLDVEFGGPARLVTRLAIDFEYHCGFLEEPTYGAIRYNSSIPYVPPKPAPLPPASVQLVSQPGDPVLNGQSRTFTRDDELFNAHRSDDSNSVALELVPHGGNYYDYRFLFSAPDHQSLALGTYEMVDRFYYPSSGYAGMLAMAGWCETVAGRFTVRELEYGPGRSIARLAIDFEQRCGALATLAGGIRFRTSLPYTPPALPVVPYQLTLLGIHPGLVPTGTTLPSVQMRVTGSDGQPFAGAHVAFATTGCVSQSVLQSFDIVSDATGTASLPDFAAGNAGRTCSIDATLAGAPLQPTVSLTYRIYAPSDISLYAMPPSITTEVGQPFRVGATVSVAGTWPSGIPVSFSVQSAGEAGATLARDQVKTEYGFASVDALANDAGGLYTIRISALGKTTSIAVLQHSPRSPRAVGRSPTGLGTIAASLFTSQSSCVFTRSDFVGVHDGAIPPEGLPPGHYVFPFGLAALRAEHCGSGESTYFTIDYPKPLPPDATFRKYGPTPDDHAPHWYRLDATIDHTQVRFAISDGGFGDDDLTANGTIGFVGGIMTAGGLYQDMWWGGPGENGWGMSVIQHGDALFSILYAYDTDGKPVWYAMPGGSWNADESVYSGALYMPHGTPFFAYDASRLTAGAPAGSISIAFRDSNQAVISYTIGGASGSRSVTRQQFGAPAAARESRYGDLWWGGASQAGWGLSVFDKGSSLFSVWFTYDGSGRDTWLVMPGGAWIASDTYEGRIYRTSGSPWLGAPYDPARLEVVDAGWYRLRFSGDAATFDYTLDGHSGSIPLARQPF